MFPPSPADASTLGLQPSAGGLTPADPSVMEAGLPAPPNPYDEKRLLELFDKLKREAFDNRWLFERDWLKENLYVANRQWITYHPSRREWVDKRLQKWVPKPVTNKMAETLQAIRTNLCAINLDVKAKPVGNDPSAIAAASIADQMAPAIHEEHDMNQAMREADYWLIVNGSVLLQVSWDTDSRFNQTFIKHEQCSTCGQVSSPKDIVAANQMCPACGDSQFQDAIDPTTGAPAGEWAAFGKGKTSVLSPFEWAVPGNVTRFDEVPYLIRMRWRDKHWFEANMPELVPKITWEKSTSDRSLQLFKSLTASSDASGTNSGLGAGANIGGEGVTEYELWLKPTPDFPEGLLMRVAGDKSPILLQLPKESIPGPFPYTDIEKKPLFPFSFAQYEHMGGKLYGRSALAPLLQKQDQLNQLDSHILLIIQRMANPIWVIPEGAGIDHVTGEPGLVMTWNPLAAGGTNAKPERHAGQEVPSSLQLIRAEIIKDIEELSGAFDIIKGQKPTGIEAFSALQLLVERSQSRFTAVFQARGEMYRKWFALAIELERQYGPQQRVWSVVGPNRGYTFKHFQNAQLQGQITIQLEDGSNVPKTFLGKRAAIEQASQLMLLDPTDPDQKYALLETFGLSDLVPTLNFHVQAALQIQDAFEQWITNPIGPSPLTVKPWFDVTIHWVERIKWLNGDKMRELMQAQPEIEGLITEHLMQLQLVLATNVPEGGAPPTPTGGGGQAMSNSNSNSGSPKNNEPKGNKQNGPNVGPA